MAGIIQRGATAKRPGIIRLVDEQGIQYDEFGVPLVFGGLDFTTGLFIGGATVTMRAGNASRTWVGLSDNGYMTYFDTSSQAATYATGGKLLGHVFAARTSEGGIIPSADYMNADSTTNTAEAWANYGHAVRRAGSAAVSVLSMERNIANVGAYVSASPYALAATGITGAYLASVGGETAQSGITVNPASFAFAIGTNGSGQAGATFGKGIVSQVGSLRISDVARGTGIVAQFARCHEVQWTYDGSEQRGGYLRADSTGPGMGLVFDNTGVTFRKADETVVASVDAAGGLAVSDLFLPASPGLMAAWSAVAGTVSAASGALGGGATVATRYKKVGRTVIFTMTITIPANGTGSAALLATLPFQANSAFVVGGKEGAATYKPFVAFATAGATVISIQNYDLTYPGANGASLVLSGTYEAAS